MSGSGASYQGHEDNFAGDYIGTQPGQSQYPGALFDPSLFGMQNNGASFVLMFYPNSFPQERTFDTGLSNAPAGQCSHPFEQQQPPAMPSSQGLGVNMSYTQMLLAADSEAAYFGSPTHAAIPLVLRTRRS